MLLAGRWKWCSLSSGLQYLVWAAPRGATGCRRAIREDFRSSFWRLRRSFWSSREVILDSSKVIFELPRVILTTYPAWVYWVVVEGSRRKGAKILTT